MQLLLPVIGSLGTFIGVVLVVILPTYRHTLMDAKRDALRDEVAIAWEVVNSSYEQERSGALTRAQAKEEACRILRRLRVGPGGRDYFFVHDENNYMLVHPYRPDLEGQDVNDLRDPTGFPLTQAFDEATRDGGGGYVEYTWQHNDDPARLVPKLSYVRAFVPWNWVVGTGVYLEDVDRQAASLRRGAVAGSVAVAAVLLVLTLYLRGLAARGERASAEAQAALAASERRLAQILEWLPDGVLVADREGRVVAWNRAAEKLTGAPAGAVLGRPVGTAAAFFYGEERPVLADLVYGHQPELEPQYEYLTRDGGRVSGEAWCPALPGGPRQVLGAAGPLRDPDGAIVGAIETFRDVTSVREAERERARLAEQLHSAQRMELLGRLAGGIAHDFNNLLCPILGFAEVMMLDGQQTPANRQLLANIVSAADRAGQLTRQLLAFGRQQAIAHAPLCLNRIVRGFEPILRGALREDIELALELADELWAVRGDAGQIEQCIMNLVVNAQDAMPHGGRLTIATRNAVLDLAPPGSDGGGPGEYACLSVSDTGEGMDEETRAKAFEPFFSTKPLGHGTGLGLSSVHGIVVQHEGHARIRSEPGSGSTVEIALPRAAAEEPSTRRQDADGEDFGGAETILVVEDDDMVRELVHGILAPRGYHVLAAAGGPEALALLADRGDPVDLLLTDVVMPRMSGPELAEALRASRPGLRVLFMSGYAGDHVASLGAVSTRNRVVEKPFTGNTLLRAVRDALRA